MRILTPLLATLLLSACATSGDGLPGDNLQIPEGAEEATRTEANGDVITEYRVAGQLRMIKVVPLRGPTYYLEDRDGDGKIDPTKGDAPVTYYKLFSF